MGVRLREGLVQARHRRRSEIDRPEPESRAHTRARRSGEGEAWAGKDGAFFGEFWATASPGHETSANSNSRGRTNSAGSVPGAVRLPSAASRPRRACPVTRWSGCTTRARRGTCVRSPTPSRATPIRAARVPRWTKMARARCTTRARGGRLGDVVRAGARFIRLGQRERHARHVPVPPGVRERAPGGGAVARGAAGPRPKRALDAAHVLLLAAKHGFEEAWARSRGRSRARTTRARRGRASLPTAEPAGRGCFGGSARGGEKGARSCWRRKLSGGNYISS